MSVAVSARVPDHHRPHPQPPRVAVAKMPARVQARPVASRPPPSVAASSSSSSSTISPRATTSTPRPAGSSPAATMAPPGRQALPALAVPGKDLSSSTGKIFAKPSKEWVLPERAKPGRKASTDEPDNRRQSQNRLSQRAHRARRTDYIQTLEERLRKYEADEIHSNVRLQEVARALKQDNERMKNELNQLAAGLKAARTERDAWQSERRQLNSSIRTLRTQLAQAEHRSPRDYDYEYGDYASSDLGLRHSPALTPTMGTPRGAPSPRTLMPSSTTISSATGSTPRTLATTSGSTTLACPICPDPDPDCPCQRLDSTLPMSTLSPSRCGLCDQFPEACLCNGAAHMHQDEDVKPVIPRSPSPGPAPADDPGCGLCTSESFCACRAGLNLGASISLPPPVASAPAASASIGIAAPAVALRLRSRPAAKQSVWALDNVPAGTSRKEAVCTGDPSNCDACRNDSFGREFCENLFGKNDEDEDEAGPGPSTAKPKKSCAGCGPGGCGSSSASMAITSLVNPPSSPVPQAPLVLACCGAPELCGHAGGCAGDVLIGGPLHNGEDDNDNDDDDDDEEVMRPDEAWHALKAHPNSKFTPLAILADVVARRAKCVGPRVELSPPPEAAPSHAHAHVHSPHIHSHALGSPIVANAASAQAQARARASAHKRRLAVETSAVREALKFLDSATPAPETERDAKRQRI